MSEPVISVRNLGKRYRLGATLRHDTLRDQLTHALKAGFGRLIQRSTSNVQRSTLNAQVRTPTSQGPEPTSNVQRSTLNAQVRTPTSQGPESTPNVQRSTLNTQSRTPAAQCPSNQPSETSVPPVPSSAFSSHPSALPTPPSPSSAFSSHPSSLSSDEFWALKDVSFDVHQGEVVGIIGRNGAGKSTLLKILSQITEPTTGEVHIRGRVASLLEVGTGFHPELSGRENIFLNGAILGMQRAEIKSKFDEIVAFAEVEKFIDTPVKRYSSGMYVRLAFAVAAHLEPEILIVDEVLAVGDVGFQKKCLGKMGDAAKQGRTVLFVSHNLVAVQSLCSRTLMLAGGMKIVDGTTEQTVGRYLSDASQLSSERVADRKDRWGSGRACVLDVTVTNQTGGCYITGTDRIRIVLRCSSEKPCSHVYPVIRISDEWMKSIYFLDSSHVGDGFSIHGETEIVCDVDAINITAGVCIVSVALAMQGGLLDKVVHACAFDVVAGDFYGTGRSVGRSEAAVAVKHRWHSRIHGEDHATKR